MIEQWKEKYAYVRHTYKGILIVALFLIGFLLRGTTAAIAPIAQDLAENFNVDLATIGLLTGIPVLCFALFSPVASILVGKRGIEFTFSCCIGLIGIGVFFRSFLGLGGLIVTTVIIGAGIALGNISIPLIAARDFPRNFAIVTGIAAASMNLGSVASQALTAPLDTLFGWRLALESWTLVVIVVFIVWVAYLFRRRRGKSRKSFRREGVDYKKLLRASELATKLDAASFSRPVGSEAGAVKSRNIYKMGFTYAICLVFICQCFAYFSFTAWLPTIFRSFSMDITTAGMASSFFQLFGILGSIGVSPLLKKVGYMNTFFVIAASWILLPLGLLFMPSLWYVWLFLAGFAQGANYILMFVKITEISRTVSETRQLSALTQITAYAVASLAPTVSGAIHSASGDWAVPIWANFACILVMTVAGVFAYWERKVA